MGPRGRKEYRVTDAGRAELVCWITNPQEDPPYRSASLLRVFLLGEVDPAQARAYLDELAAHADSELTRLGRLRDSLPSVELPSLDGGDALFFGGAALDYGLRTAAMEGDWARSQIKALDARQTAER